MLGSGVLEPMFSVGDFSCCANDKTDSIHSCTLSTPRTPGTDRYIMQAKTITQDLEASVQVHRPLKAWLLLLLH